MPIVFKCEHCERNIEVSDEMGGQMGQCPHCGHTMYIPLPDGEESEPLELTEVEPDEEERLQRELEQSRQAMRRLWSDRRTDDPDQPNSEIPTRQPQRTPKPIDPEDALLTIEQYVLAMAHSSLEEADAMAAHLVGNPKTVNPIIKKALSDGLNSPSLKNVPEALKKGFLKKLLEYLN